MKLRLLLFLSAFVYLSDCKAQTWIYHPMPGIGSHWALRQTWVCTIGFPGGNSRSYSIVVGNDTVIGSGTYHKLRIPYFKTDSSGCYPYSVVTNIYKGAFREDTLARKVYYVPPSFSTEELLFDFTLQIGDTLNGFLASAGTPDTVIDMDSVMISPGNYVKRWLINALNSIYLIEGVGWTYGLVEKSPGTAPGWDERDILCMNGTTYYYPNITDCEVITGLTQNEQQTQLDLFPNPANDHIVVRSDIRLEDAVWFLYNSLGEKVMSVPLSYATEIKISTAELLPGIYFASITEAGKKCRSQKIIIAK